MESLKDYELGNLQITFDNLSKQVKEKRKILFDDEIFSEFLTSIHKWDFELRLSTFKNSLSKYEYLLTKAYSEKDTNLCYEHHYKTFYNKTIPVENFNERKVFLLERIVDAYKLLITTRDENILSTIESLEEQVEVFFGYWDKLIIDAFQFFTSNIVRTHIAKEVKSISGLLFIITKKYFKNRLRDIRFCFRSIVRFLFKNMDDESDANNVMFSGMRLQTLFNIQKHHLDEFRRNNQATFYYNRIKSTFI
ncbi:MAG TPA: hypothetical protein VHB70_07450 [Parafilimonas sp.]|nr:hypothetical protein [Parafilimonas sp.]